MSLSSPDSSGEFLSDVPGSDDINKERTGFEATWQCPESMGSGFIHVVKLRPGLLLGFGDFLAKQELSRAFEYTDLPVVFRYECESAWHYASSDRNQNFCFNFKPGFTTVCFHPKWAGTATFPAGHPICSVCLYVDPALLLEFFKDEDPRFAEAGYEILAAADHRPLLSTFATSPGAGRVISEIFHCPFTAPLKRIYLEGKVLELLTHSMGVFLPRGIIKSVGPAVMSFDRDRVRKARDLLGENLENPPTLPELAHAVGLSRSRLHRDFQQAYGLTPFEYLHTKRLETAKRFLSAGRLNVTETAYAVGYQNLSHFAKAFKKQFGQPPGRFRKACLSRS